MLQTGSSVLVDKAGVVRVRCKCGNPLTPLERLTAKPVYQGQPWVGFVDIDIIVIKTKKCDDDEYWDGRECRDIDCKDGYYYDGGACRPIECDDDEELDDGYCRPIECDNDERRTYDGRGCAPVECDDGYHFDGNGCEKTECPSGEILSGDQCQTPECPELHSFDSEKGNCVKTCPDMQIDKGSGCVDDPCAQDAETDDCNPQCDDPALAWIPAEGRCGEPVQTALLTCEPGSVDPDCQQTGASQRTLQANTGTGTTSAGTTEATDTTTTTETSTPGTGTDGAGTQTGATDQPGPAVPAPTVEQPVIVTPPVVPCPTNPMLEITDIRCLPAVDPGPPGGGTGQGQGGGSGQSQEGSTTDANGDGTTPSDENGN